MPTTPVPQKHTRIPDIVTIPEKFYGMALKMKGMTAAELEAEKAKPTPPPAPVPPPPLMVQPAPERSHTTIILVLGLCVFVLLIAGGFIYMNRDRLWPKAVVPAAPVLVLPPSPPASVAASVVGSGTSVALRWNDDAANETGFRVERKEGDGTYILLTNLPQNSTAFTDVSPSEGRSYSYRVYAVNAGGDSGASNEVTVQVPKSTPPPPPAPTLPPGGLDSDSDGLSDVEEVAFGSNSHNPDTDGDGFLDGNEVFNLYNPSAKAPVRIADSGIVTSTVSSSGWSLMYPKTWRVSMGADQSGAVFETGTGEKFAVEVAPLPAGQTVMDAFLAEHTGLLSTEVRSLKTKSGLDGLATPDGKEAIFAWKDHVWKMRYDMGTQVFMNYRTTFEMMLNSLTLTGAPTIAVTSTVGMPGSLLGGESATSTAVTPVATSTPPITASTSTPSVTAATTTSVVTPRMTPTSTIITSTSSTSSTRP